MHRRAPRRAVRAVALGAVVAGLLAGCGGAGKGDAASTRRTDSLPTPGAPGRPGTTTTEPMGTAAQNGGQPIRNPGAFPEADQFSPAASGDYQESVVGSYTLGGRTVKISSSGTLQVGSPNSAVQTWEESSGPRQPVDSLSVAFLPDGIVMQAESLGLAASQPSCVYTPPVPVLPLNPVFGQTIQSQASCGKFAATVTSLIEGTGSITLGGVNYATLEVRSTVRTVGTNPAATVIETSWVSPTLRLPLQETQQTSTTYDGSPYQITTTTELLSAVPSGH